MSLADIKNKLYKKDKDKDLSEHDKSEYDATTASDNAGKGKFSVINAWEEKEAGFGKEQKKAIAFGLVAIIGILFVVGGAVGLYKFNQSAFGEEKVSITISGPKESRSGDVMTYEVSYKNNNRVSLKEAVVRLNFPDNLRPEDNPNFISESPSNGRFDLGEINKYSEGKITFRGKAFSPTGSLIYIKADLGYKPSNFNSQAFVFSPSAMP